jgi:hypothetical protein
VSVRPGTLVALSREALYEHGAAFGPSELRLAHAPLLAADDDSRAVTNFSLQDGIDLLEREPGIYYLVRREREREREESV